VTKWIGNARNACGCEHTGRYGVGQTTRPNRAMHV